MMKVTNTDKAPAAIGPYSQAIAVNGMLYTSGQIPIDPAVGDVVATTIQDQAEQVMKNLGAVFGSKRFDIYRRCKNNLLLV